MTTYALSNTVGYLGWTGHGNMGDEAIHQALVHSLPGLDLVPVPLGPRAAVAAHSRLPLLHRSPLVLGGGTVLGRRIWRFHLLQALALSAPGPALMLGAGVEDPSFAREGHLSERRELPKWRRLLGRFHEVTVRGPRSAELLADVGIEARVVGDPALLLDPDMILAHAPASDEGHPLLGINLGVSDDLWGHDQARVVDEMATAVRHLAALGWRFRALVVNPADRPDALRCRDMSGIAPDRWEVCDVADPAAYLAAVGPCRLVVAERLHAGVLAARLAVPPVMLEYQPKCRDFLRSVGLEDFGVRTDRLTASRVVDLVQAADDEQPALTGALGERVHHLRETLAAEADKIVARVGSVETARR